MSYSLTRKLLQATGNVLCDQIVSLDAYQHWFDSAESGTRPDLLWIVARIGGDGRLSLDMRLIELVASFVNRSNLLKSWEKTETCAGSASGAYGPNNAAITRIPVPYAATESHHFSDRTALA